LRLVQHSACVLAERLRSVCGLMVDFMPPPSPSRGGKTAVVGGFDLLMFPGGGSSAGDRDSSPEGTRGTSDVVRTAGEVARRRIRRDAKEARRQAATSQNDEWDSPSAGSGQAAAGATLLAMLKGSSGFGTGRTSPAPPAPLPPVLPSFSASRAPLLATAQSNMWGLGASTEASWGAAVGWESPYCSGSTDELRAGLYSTGLDAGSRWAGSLRSGALPERLPLYAAWPTAHALGADHASVAQALASVPAPRRSVASSSSASRAACATSAADASTDGATSSAAINGDAEDIDLLLRCCATAHLDGDLSADGYSRQGGLDSGSAAGCIPISTEPSKKEGAGVPGVGQATVSRVADALFSIEAAAAAAALSSSATAPTAPGLVATGALLAAHASTVSTSVGSGSCSDLSGSGSADVLRVSSGGAGGGRSSGGGDASRIHGDSSVAGGGRAAGGRAQSSQLAQDTLEKVFKPWCKQRATQLFRFAHKRFAAGEGRGGIVFQFARTSDISNGLWPVDEAGWTYMSQRNVGSLGIKTNHVLSAVQRYSPQQQCVVIALVKEAKFDRFYFSNAPKSHSGPGRMPASSGDRSVATEWPIGAGQYTPLSSGVKGSPDSWNGASGQLQNDGDSSEASQQQSLPATSGPGGPDH